MQILHPCDIETKLTPYPLGENPMSEFTKFDDLLTKNDTAAIVLRQHLKPVEGENAVIFPPTFATVGYNIDDLGDGKNVCLIDSVGSQANRMEPIFKEPPYSELVPQIMVKVKIKAGKDEQKKDMFVEEDVNLLDAGHRLGDAVARLSNMGDEIQSAFMSLQKKNDATEMAKMSPTSLLFGCWDSRYTGTKLPRVIRSIIRAFDVHPLTRSAQFTAAFNDTREALFASEEVQNANIKTSKGTTKQSALGMDHSPATGTLGGVILDQNSELIRETVISLSALRRIKGADAKATLNLQRYILGLALVVFSAPQEQLLRMGCELVPDPNHPLHVEKVETSGVRKEFEFSHDNALAYAKTTAENFGVGNNRDDAQFDEKTIKEGLKYFSKKDSDAE
ncbi:MAG: type I-G CRISPR-associated RAMP protein Csb1/Cas7g [Thermoguttaceae bacterium]